MAPEDATGDGAPASGRSVWSRIGVAVVALAVLTGGGALLWRFVLGPRVDAVPSRTVTIVAAVALLAVVAVMYLWRRTSLWRLRRAERRERALVLERAARATDALVAEAVDLAGVTLTWAVRAELLRDDLRDVEEYMLQLAKHPHVTRVVVARQDGTIIASTSPASKGGRLNGAVENLPAESSQSQVQHPTDQSLRLVVPIMGLEARLGTLVLEYAQTNLVTIVEVT